MSLHISEASSLLVSFSGALQASVSVLLTLAFGFFAARFRMISPKAQKEISGLCINIFLPALLIVTVGKEIGRPENRDEKPMYGGFILWGLFYSLTGVAIGYATQRLLGLPKWTTPAVAFNNTTSLPLLLVQSLQTTGFLDSLVTKGTSDDAVRRAQAFFLINAIVNKSLILSLGPKLLFGSGFSKDNNSSNGNSSSSSRRRRYSNRSLQTEDGGGGDETEPNEATSLLPETVQGHIVTAQDYAQSAVEHLPQPARQTLDLATSVFNPALVAALFALVIGLTPELHKAFFAKGQSNGIFTGWLTSAAENVGDLFGALQMFVVGANLSGAAEEVIAKKRNRDRNNSRDEETDGDGDDGGDVNGRDLSFSWVAVAVVILYRFIVWTVISCSIVYLLAYKLRWLSKDPIVWFTMALMPVGPPAMIIVPLIDITASTKPGQKDPKTDVSKMVALMYAITPVIAIPVVAALKLSEKMMKDMNI